MKGQRPRKPPDVDDHDDDGDDHENGGDNDGGHECKVKAAL